VHSFIDDIDALLTDIDTGKSKPAKDMPDKELLSLLLEACNNYIIDDVETLIEQIDEYRYEADGGLADWLKHNTDLMNYGKIVEKLSEFVE